MLTKVTGWLIFQCCQSLTKHLPVKYVNTHRRFVAAWMLRFFFKLLNTSGIVCDNNTETACFLHWYLIGCQCDIGLACLVIVKHRLIIHLIDMISGENQYIVWIVVVNILKILIDCVRSTCIPLAVCTLLVWRKYGYTTNTSIQIPWDTDTDVLIEPEWSILCQHADSINPRINTVAEWEIDNLVFSTKCNRRLSKLRSQNAQTTPLSAC